MKRMIHPLLCWLLTGALAWAGVLKAMNPAAFAEAIMGFNLVPWPVASVLALYLPWLEIVTAAALVVPRWRTSGLVIASVLFTSFVLILALTWWRGIDVTCGCFGSTTPTSLSWALLRATLLAALAWYCAHRSDRVTR
jgi:putative oxidoreductase